MMNSKATVLATRGGHIILLGWISPDSHPDKVGVQLTMRPCIVLDPKRAHTQPSIWINASDKDTDVVSTPCTNARREWCQILSLKRVHLSDWWLC